MFQVKYAFLFFAFSLSLIFALGQGKFSYQPVDFAVVLPADSSISNQLQASSFYSNLTDFEKEFLFNLNYARKYPKDFADKAIAPYLVAYPALKNVYGSSLLQELNASMPMNILLINIVLTGLARSHAKDLGKHDLMSHTSSNGQTTQDRFEKNGISCGSECINMAQGAGALEVLISLLIDYNVPNYGHRKSLLSLSMTTVGVGAAMGTDGIMKYTVIDLGCM